MRFLKLQWQQEMGVSWHPKGWTPSDAVWCPRFSVPGAPPRTRTRRIFGYCRF